MTPTDSLAPYIDHTLLKPGTKTHAIELLCQQAIQYRFAAVCVPPLFVKLAKKSLLNSNVLVATVVGFPLGYCAIEAKMAEIVLALVDGVDEIDMVINFTAIKNNDWEFLANEINHCLPIIKTQGKTVKVIIESGLLNPSEIIKCCEIYGASGVDFMKTSTGYSESGATIEAVSLMRQHLPHSVKIKASGGIREAGFAWQLIQAGASRIGTSNGVQMMEGINASKSEY